MNKTENNRDFMEIILLVLLTFIIVFLLRSSFNRRANKVVVTVSDLTSMSDYRDIGGDNRIHGNELVSVDVQRGL